MRSIIGKKIHKVVYAGRTLSDKNTTLHCFFKLKKNGEPDTDKPLCFPKKGSCWIGDCYQLEQDGDNFIFPRFGLKQLDNDQINIPDKLVKRWEIDDSVVEAFIKNKARSRKPFTPAVIRHLGEIKEHYRFGSPARKAAIISKIIFFLEE